MSCKFKYSFDLSSFIFLPCSGIIVAHSYAIHCRNFHEQAAAILTPNNAVHALNAAHTRFLVNIGPLANPVRVCMNRFGLSCTDAIVLVFDPVANGGSVPVNFTLVNAYAMNVNQDALYNQHVLWGTTLLVPNPLQSRVAANTQLFMCTCYMSCTQYSFD